MARSNQQQPTKTEQRRQRIKRGAAAGSTLAEKAGAKAAIEEIRQVDRQPQTDHGAADSREIQQRQAVAESMAADNYRPLESAPTPSVEDPRHIPLSYLLADLRARVKVTRDCRGWSKSERADIATDAAMILMRWTKQGAKAPCYCGARGELPFRRDWYDAERRTVISDRSGRVSSRPAPNARAERAMRAAILQAARDRNSDAEQRLAAAAAELEQLPADADSSESTLARQALADHWRQSERAPALPDTDAPELLADALGVTLQAARAVLARGYRMTAADCAEQWRISTATATKQLSAGAAEIRKRWPEPRDLLDALAAAAPAMREQLCTRAYLALSDLAADQTKRAEQRAALAVDHWRSAAGELEPQRRAVELAAARVGWQPEHISAADHIERLIRAEQRRGRQLATSAARSSRFTAALSDRCGGPSEQQRHKLAPSSALPSSSYGRAKVYGRLAAQRDGWTARQLILNARASKPQVSRAAAE